MPARRLRLLGVLVVVAIAGLTLVPATLPWWMVRVPDHAIEVSGTVASPALSALALAELALAAALALAGPVFRVMLGVLQLLIGFTVVLVAALSLADPVRASAALISTTTGVAGERSVVGLVLGVDYTPWPWIAIVLGALAFLGGGFILATFRRWPGPSRKYQALGLAAAETPGSAPQGSSIADWDTLSEGGDPTEDAGRG